MSDINNAEEIVEEWTLDDLQYFWMSNGLPVFFSNQEQICDIVESLGFNIYYVLGNLEKTTTQTTGGSVNYNNNNKTANVTPVTTKTTTMQLFKVVNNFVGRTVSLSNESFDAAFDSLEEEATYNMPAIPHIMIDKLDQFFRLVDAQHGTESIVMLTYDMDKEGSEGWGILVPEQTNTSVHCNYDPDSIARIKPDNVMIVGSVHSHPGMAAYASGTDHKDQADFDGIHITFGWQKSVNNGATQYYIEMQMAGKAYKLDPEDVFEDYIIDKAPDPEVVDWTGKVKKELPPSSVGGSARPLQAPIQQGSTASGTDWQTSVQIIPDFHLENNALIVAEISNEKEDKCPACGSINDSYDIYSSYCEFCLIPLAIKNEGIGNIIDNLSFYCLKRNISTKVPAYLWCKDDDKLDFVIRLTPTTIEDALKSNLAYSETPPSLLTEDSISDNPFYDVRQEYLLCCGIHQEKSHFDCWYNKQITYDDYLHFDTSVGSLNIYNTASQCNGCEYYYDISCPSLVKCVEEYTYDNNLIPEDFANRIDGNGCTKYVSYSATQTLFDHYE